MIHLPDGHQWREVVTGDAHSFGWLCYECGAEFLVYNDDDGTVTTTYHPGEA